MMKCKCAECGITKTKYIKGQAGCSYSTDSMMKASKKIHQFMKLTS